MALARGVEGMSPRFTTGAFRNVNRVLANAAKRSSILDHAAPILGVNTQLQYALATSSAFARGLSAFSGQSRQSVRCLSVQSGSVIARDLPANPTVHDLSNVKDFDARAQRAIDDHETKYGKRSDLAIAMIDVGQVELEFERFVNAFDEQGIPIRPHFSVKTNPDPEVVRALAKLGSNFDVASGAEIRLVEQILTELGESRDRIAERIIFAHPRKMGQDMELAKEVGIKRMTFDSVSEIARMDEIFCAESSAPLSNDNTPRNRDCSAEFILRMHCEDPNKHSGMGEKFGACEQNWGLLFDELERRGLKEHLKGVSFHTGSGLSTGAAQFEQATREAAALRKAAKDRGFPNVDNVLDIGGGFRPKHDINQYGQVVRQTLEKDAVSAVEGDDGQTLTHTARRTGGAWKEIIAEPGTFLVAGSTQLLAKCIGKGDPLEGSRPWFPWFRKQNHITRYYMSEGVWGFFLPATKEMDAPVVVRRTSAEVDPSAVEDEEAILFGPTLDGADRLPDRDNKPTGKYTGPSFSVGDYVGYANVGAYKNLGAGPSSVNRFNGISTPAKFYYRSIGEGEVLERNASKWFWATLPFGNHSTYETNHDRD